MVAAARSHYISNALLVLPDTDAELQHGDVFVENGKIAALPAYAEERRAARERADAVFDATGMILMPGLVNAHYHSYGCALKGTCNDLPLELWALYTVAYGSALGEEAIRLAALLGAAEMVRNGVTACIDHFPHLRWADSALAGHQQSGMRVGFAPMLHDVPDWRFFALELPPEQHAQLLRSKPMTAGEFAAFFRELHQRWHDPDRRISIMLGPNAPQRCSAALRKLWRQLDEDLAPLVHTHLLETRLQARQAREQWHGGVVSLMAREGLLHDRLSVAHGIWTDAEDRERLIGHGVTLVHNPVSNCFLGSGRMPLVDYLEHGAAIALGSDSSNSAGRLDLFEAMRMALALPRLEVHDYTRWPRPRTVFEMATQGGARALGHAGELGRIAVGQLADLVLLQCEHAGMAALELGIRSLVHHAGADAVVAVMIDGAWVFRDGRIQTFDERAAVARFQGLAADLEVSAGPGVKLAEGLRPHFARLHAGQTGE